MRHHSFVKSSTACSIALVLGLVLTGCGKKELKPVGISGKVTFKDKPVPGAQVSFLPEDSPSAQPTTAITGTDGSYKVTHASRGDGLMPGRYKVIVREAQSLTLEDIAAGKKQESVLPKAYASFDTSDLRVEVIPDTQEIGYDIPLKE